MTNFLSAIQELVQKVIEICFSPLTKESSVTLHQC